MQRRLTGAATAELIKARVYEDVAQLQRCGVHPTLAIVRAGENEDDIAYESSLRRRLVQAGIVVRTIAMDQDCSETDCVEALSSLSRDREVHGVLLMRPLPKQLNQARIIGALDVQKDVDGMTPSSLAAVFMSNRGFVPCTAEAVARLLQCEGIEVEGKEVVIIGRSLVVGKPLAMLLLNKNATVTLCHSRTHDLDKVCQRADILVVAAGRRAMVDGSFVKSGAVLVDVGIHTDENGHLCGDIDPSAYEIAGAYTPVPGGVGVVTGWLMAEHVVMAAKHLEGLL